LQTIRIDKQPIEHVPYTNRDPTWIRPELVAEIKFSGWTEEKIMRAPIFLRFRENKEPEECLIEGEKPTEKMLEKPFKKREQEVQSKNAGVALANEKTNIESAHLSFSNLDKVFWGKTSTHPQLTKRDLITYYEKISPSSLNISRINHYLSVDILTE
jgi:bifunctional non-homologous end joining protein LigD